MYNEIGNRVGCVKGSGGFFSRKRFLFSLRCLFHARLGCPHLMRCTVLATGVPHKHEHVGANPTTATKIQAYTLMDRGLIVDQSLRQGRFDSCCLDKYALVGKLVKPSALHAEYRRFESCRVYMRKRLKKKKRCCALCKPFKRAKQGRWKDKELSRLKQFEKEKKGLLV